MVTSCCPNPVWLNGWKHHLGFLCRQLQKVRSGESRFEAFCQGLKLIGSSVTDLYTGKLAPDSICQQILQQLHKRNHFSSRAYTHWITGASGQYRELVLSDGSRWTLLQGRDPEFHIHIHPSRFSAHSCRLKANALATALVIRAWQAVHSQEEISAGTINALREDYLGLSPVHSGQLQRVHEILRMLEACSG